MKVVNFYNTNAPKKAANLSINSDLLMKAKELHINLSNVLENHLIEMLAEAKQHEWKKENRDAIEAYNHRIQTKGVFSEGLRKF
ncbi:MAG: type II toxin-antitoxin system CcdA family antitoxin [Desulfobacterales bacterium]|nr:type II toxin-antitoxin system CcdA family antitoxin [Desulfobacterales bacterium]